MRAYHSCYITSLPCASSHTAQPVCWRAMSPPQVPDTWYQGAGKKSWCRVMQFLHVDALCRLCSCVVAHTRLRLAAPPGFLATGWRRFTPLLVPAGPLPLPPEESRSSDLPQVVSAPQVSRPRELKYVWQTRCISPSPSRSATPHVPWRYLPQTLHGWFVKSGGPGV